MHKLTDLQLIESLHSYHVGKLADDTMDLPVIQIYMDPYDKLKFVRPLLGSK